MSNLKPLRIIPLGGMGKVTQNMFVYEYGNELLIVDCGIGFPDVYMPGVDVLIPDISYLQQLLKQGKQIKGMVFSHGHDDHIGAAGYLLPELPDFPLYASPLTAAFTKNRLRDKKVKKSVEIVKDLTPVKVGNHFEFEFISITHSVPDTKHIVINTPQGVIYHGSDFKLDPNPVDGQLTDFESISKVGDNNLLCALLDCVRVERSEWTPSESSVGPAIEHQMANVSGKIIVTLMSSHIHRIQQVIDAAVKINRKVAFIGMSVEQNVKVAFDLQKLSAPKGTVISKKKIKNYSDNQLVLIIAGSQGQEGSSLVRAVYGEHRIVQIDENDKVIFSADAIPGNEVPYFQSIDELARNGIDVIYPDVAPDLHHSGHAGELEQLEMVSLLKPKYVMPIGGEDRHRAWFNKTVAKKANLKKEQVLLPKNGDIITFENGHCSMKHKISIKPQIIDGLGIGDVGPVVLNDRRALSESGIIVIVVPKVKNRYDFDHIEVVSRGFVFMKEADSVVDFIKKETTKLIHKNIKKKQHELKYMIEKKLSRKLYKMIQRDPMVLVAFMDL